MTKLTVKNGEVLKYNGGEYMVSVTEIPNVIGGGGNKNIQVDLCPQEGTPLFNENDEDSGLVFNYGQSLTLLGGDLELTIVQ